jgi:hypothetical protein
MMQDGWIDGREIIPRTETYFIHVSGDAMARLAAISGIPWHQNQTRGLRNQGWAGEGYMFLPVRAARNEDYDGKVYNLSVEEDQSYLTPHGIAHNCLDNKHSLYLEAATEELVAQDPGNPVYPEILRWIEVNQPKVSVEAILSGRYTAEYPKMALQFKEFRKRVMGTVALSDIHKPGTEINLDSVPGEEITLAQAKKIASAEAAREIEKQWHSLSTK